MSLRLADGACAPPQDALQSTGLKKSQIQRALDTLAESGRCLCTVRRTGPAPRCAPPLARCALTRAAPARARVAAQENGKQKIYLAPQDQSAVPPEARAHAFAFAP